MELLYNTFQQEWAIRALIAGVLVGLMCGLLGSFIVLRNMSLVGDALAHAILPGIVVSFVLVGYNVFGFFLGAVGAGLLTAFAITWIQQKGGTKNDAAIGIAFTAMFSLGVIGISQVSKQEGVHLDLKDFLFGNILGVSNVDLQLTATITLIIILGIIFFYRPLFATTFQPVIAQTMGISVEKVHYLLMLMLSFAVVASLQSVGVILVVSMLITPASTALLIEDRLEKVIVLSGVLGIISAVSGLILAIVLDTTPGPAIALTATFIYLIALLLAPKRGLIRKWNNRRIQKQRIQFEDFLKAMVKIQERGLEHTVFSLSENSGLPKEKVISMLKALSSRKLIEFNGSQWSMLEEGQKQGNRLVRAHRLWETYLVEELGFNAEQIHQEADEFEHFIPESILEEVDAKLGYPERDPHGKIIPR
jgi:ABC-type Mn2+/Zn2+ transport system permease subunit/Mn-dependent DtxR family transcriptional regulator